MSKGWVHSWDISIGVDGPGTRLVIFLSGCPLRCLYCQNPDTWLMRAGTKTPLEDMTALMRRYRGFISQSGGGLTISGGEPLQQPAFTRALLEQAQGLGLHTAIDTSGYLGEEADDALLAATNLVLLDVKAGSGKMARALTQHGIKRTRAFGRRLAALGIPVWLRYVLVPGYNDDPAEVEAVASYAASLGNVERVDVLPFHKLGEEKYERLGVHFPLSDHPTPSAELTTRVRNGFAAHALAVR